MLKREMCAALAAVAILTTCAGAQTREIWADLSGLNEVPANDSDATGRVEGVYDFLTNTFTFSWVITDNLTGTPSLPGAHIHRAPVGVNGPIAFGFAPADGMWELVGEATWTDITPADVELLLNGGLYINFHTTSFPGGEVRGQLVPTPGAVGLGCVAGLTLLRRRR